MADPDLQRVDNALAGLGTQVDPTDPDVFLGNDGRMPAPGPPGEPRYQPKPKLAKQSEANLVIRDTLELKRWEKVLLDAGKIEEGKYDYSTLVQLWEGYVQESAAWLAKGKRMSPYDLVELDADLSGSRKKKADGNNGKSTNTQTSTSVDLTDPTTARGIIDSAYQSATGQAPTDAQREDFLSMLNDAERRNPNVSSSTQTSTTKGSGTGDSKTNTDSSNLSSGGVNPQVLAQDQAMQDPGYGSYQAATTYANALFEALKSPV